jgi:hypothetical protein
MERPMKSTIRDRIIEFRRFPARELFNHLGHPRRHPQAQRNALRGVLEQVGIAGALIAYYSERNGGRLTLIDGHLRKEDYNLDWPTLILDLTDEEADLLLVSHDQLAALAEYDKPELDAMLQIVRVHKPAVAAMLTDLAKKAGAGPEDEEKVALPQEKYEIVVQCAGEQDQREVYDYLTREGLPCRVLTS